MGDLFTAAREGNIQAIKNLIAAKVNVNSVDGVRHPACIAGELTHGTRAHAPLAQHNSPCVHHCTLPPPMDNSRPPRSCCSWALM